MHFLAKHQGKSVRTSMNVAPIALFVYNRPSHTRQTVEALQKNILAKDSDLFVFSDAAKTAEQTDAVQEVREYIRQIDGFKSITIVERETNFGLACSIIDGVTKLCKQYGRVIVLEDDIVTSPYFLRFMNDSLDMYENEDKVMHISGSTYPIETMDDNTFFLRVPLCWGWGTWDRSWQHFRKNNDVMSKFDQKMRLDFTFNDTYDTWVQLELNKKGIINTWFVFWYATLFLRGGLALFPGKSLVRNIGMDGTGVHSGASNYYDMELTKTAIQLEPIPIVESREAVIRHENFFRNQNQTISPLPKHVRIFYKVRRIAELIVLAIKFSFELLRRGIAALRQSNILERLRIENPGCTIMTGNIHNSSLGESVAVFDRSILRHVYLGSFSYVSNDSMLSNVEVGRFCSIGPYVQIGLGPHPSKTFVSTYPAFYSDHTDGCPLAFRENKIFDDSIPKTILGNDVWVGANAIIPGGINIGTGAIVAAGAVVVKDVPPYAIVGGNPAKVIRFRFSEDQIQFLQKSEWWNWPIEKIRYHVDDFSDIKLFVEAVLPSDENAPK